MLAPAKRKREFGDYQTPPELADRCCRLVQDLGIRPVSLLEPTCGVGRFLQSALRHFPEVEWARGIEINEEYAREASERTRAEIEVANIFTLDWSRVMQQLTDPLLIIGNPPWVTNSSLCSLGSANLPVKENVHRHAGLDALTGKSNFDISEWILLRLFEQMNGRNGAVAMLCKTAVARKALRHAWKNDMQTGRARMFGIDSKKQFSAAVDACLLVCPFAPGSSENECVLESGQVMGYRDGELIADVRCYDAHKHLRGPSAYKWRSGIKHDCATVMEFRREGGWLKNGLGEVVDIEDSLLFPLMKSSDVGSLSEPRRYVLVPQTRIAEDTSMLQQRAPKTWEYLQRHRERFESRGSAIYRGRPAFSIFGVGEYAFAPWKVAISGFYKSLRFRVIGPFEDRPVMLDDTVYFLPCYSGREAAELAGALNSAEAVSFFSARVFWDAKRPITVSLLGQLSIEKLVAGAEAPCKLKLAPQVT